MLQGGDGGTGNGYPVHVQTVRGADNSVVLRPVEVVELAISKTDIKTLWWESCICCASTLSSCLRSCLPHLTMVLLWIKEYQVSYRPDCCPKSGSPGGPPLFSITVAVVLTASAVQSHYLYVNLLEYFLPGKGVFKAQCCCYDLI